VKRGRAVGSAFACVRCGAEVVRRRRATPDAHTHPLEIRCANCRYLIYDYPRPCAGMLVTRDDRLLVLRRGHAPKRGWLDTPGGFIDAGEDIEGAARRELREETGITVGGAEPFGFYWDRYYLKGFGFIPTMNFYYLARWRGGEPVAADDAASVEWAPIRGLGGARSRFAFQHMNEVVKALKRRLRAWPGVES
jgi:ADP-ribose pyrophosphatase YjhB (NUDIX family)